MCELIVGLTKEQQVSLCRYLVHPLDGPADENSMDVDIVANNYESQFLFTLYTFHHLIRTRLLSRISGGSSFSPNSEPVIMNATKCIAILCMSLHSLNSILYSNPFYAFRWFE
jgi:hypothetical protein